MIPIYACDASGNTIFKIDDPSADTDRGVSFVARMLSAAFEARLASVSHLRRLVQRVHITESCTVSIKPIADESDDPLQSTTFNLTAVVDGQSAVADADPDSTGTLFQIEVAISDHVGETELGECETHFTVRRGRVQ